MSVPVYISHPPAMGHVEERIARRQTNKGALLQSTALAAMLHEGLAMSATNPTLTARDLISRMRVKRYSHSWRGDCPVCNYRGTFSIREGKDGRALLWCANGCSRDDINDAVGRVTGGSWRPAVRPDAKDEAAIRERKQAAALGLWNGEARGARCGLPCRSATVAISTIY